MLNTRTPGIVLLLSLALSGAAQAGTVTVSYAPNARFTDAGAAAWDREANMRDLDQFLQSLGQRYLPADRTMTIEILDVDLAGDVKLFRRHRTDSRVARGGADWPRISLRYSLQSNGQVLKSGEETVADMNYLNHVADSRGNESLHFEKRMLEQWFKKRFVAQTD